MNLSILLRRVQEDWPSLLSVATAFLILAETVSAFEVRPEYHSLPSERGFLLMDPKKIDSDYEATLVFQAIPPWYSVESARAPGRLFFSTGPLSSSQADFHLVGEFKTRMAPNFGVQFVRLEDINYEENVSASILELELGSGAVSLGMYAKVGAERRQDDIGLALIRHDRGGDSRLFVELPDYARNAHNDESDYFESGSEPLVYGFLSRRDGSEFFIRREAQVKWRNPTSGQQYLYEQTAIGSTFASSVATLRWFLDRKETSLKNTATGDLNAVLRDRHEVEVRRVVNGSSYTLEWGLSWTARHWHDQLARRLTHENLTPFVWIRDGSGMELGMQTTTFRAYGDSALAGARLKWSSQETRLNTRYRLNFGNHGELLLSLAVNVDRAFNRDEDRWIDGGQALFLINF